MTLDRRAVRMLKDIIGVRVRLQKDPECQRPGWVQDSAVILLVFEACFVNNKIDELARMCDRIMEKMAEDEASDAGDNLSQACA
jgi:hypothetical protein